MPAPASDRETSVTNARNKNTAVCSFCGRKLRYGTVGDTKIAKAIRKKRIASALGMRETALQAGVSTATICRIEGGKMPDVENAVKIAEWLGQSLDSLLR